MNRTIYLAVAAILTMSVTQAAAVPITIGAAEDAYGQGDSAGDTVFGGGVGSDLLVRGSTNQPNFSRKTWIRFDLSAYDIDLNLPVTLQLQRFLGTNTNSGTGDVRVHGLKTGFTPGSGVLGTNWEENALTWNNGPANVTTHERNLTSDAGLINTFTFDDTASGEGGEFYNISIGSLGDYLQADNSLTLILTGADATRVYLASRQNGTLAGPQLTFTEIVPVPEPATGTIFGMGGIMCLAFARKRRRRARGA